MVLNSRLVSVILSSIIYAASLFVSPDILINQKGCYHDFTVHSFDQLKFQGYLEKNVKSSNNCSLHYSKSDSWDGGLADRNHSQFVFYITDLPVRSITNSPIIRSGILQMLLFPFHSFW